MLEEGCSSKDLQQDEDGISENMERDNTKDKELVISKHPYEHELSQFKPNSWQWEEQAPQMYAPVEESKLTMVDSQMLLDEMMLKLREVKELAIDLEHHSYRSFEGMVCLIQISTRQEDFIVDSFVLREQLHVLNDVCTNTNILKILHGSDRDIGWLQRDFGVFIINMFDTSRAARILNEKGLSLAHILKRYCDVDVDKQYQLADWRIRPLPKEMIKYAREDTHYLLYIYDIYRNLLLERGDETKNLLAEVYAKSTELCTMLDVKPVFHPTTHLAVYKKCKGKLNVQQLECFRLLYAWRDSIARREDESTGYTLPNRMMFQIAKAMPSDPEGIISTCHPLPSLVSQYIKDVHQLILQAIENVPDIPVEPSESTNVVKAETEDVAKSLKEQERQLAIKNLEKTKKGAGGNRSCFECGKFGHRAKDCVQRRGRVGSNTPMRGGPPNRGRSFIYGGYPSGVRDRGGAGIREYHGRHYQAEENYNRTHYRHPYDNATLHHSHWNNMYQGVGSYNAGIYPFSPGMNVRATSFNPEFHTRPRNINPYNPYNPYNTNENPNTQGTNFYSGSSRAFYESSPHR